MRPLRDIRSSTPLRGGRGIGRVALLLCCLAAAPLPVLAPLPAFAVQPDEVLKDPALEARARALSGELRCMVCQNQSIDDSDAPLAKDIRVLVRERLTAGDSDRQVKAFLVARYGDFILLKPPLEPRTVLLWSAPFVLLAAGALGAWLAARRRPAAAPAPLSDTEARAVEDILKREA